MKITHYDLFAGIGGFSLALDTIFHEQKNEHIFCEWEAFPTAVLKKHWSDLSTTTMPNGKLIKESAKCDECADKCQINNGFTGLIGAYYIYNGKKLCRRCAKAIRLV